MCEVSDSLLNSVEGEGGVQTEEETLPTTKSTISTSSTSSSMSMYNESHSSSGTEEEEDRGGEEEEKLQTTWNFSTSLLSNDGNVKMSSDVQWPLSEGMYRRSVSVSRWRRTQGE